MNTLSTGKETSPAKFVTKQKSTVRVHHNIDSSENPSVSVLKKAEAKNTHSVKTLKIQESYPDSAFIVAKVLNNQPFSFKDQSIQHASNFDDTSVGVGQGLNQGDEK